LTEAVDTNPNLVYSIPTMNDMIDTTSDLRNLITITPEEVYTEQPNLTEEELEAADDARFHAELTDYVNTLPVPTEDQLARYNEKMEFLASIRAEIPALNVVEETIEESYAVPAGRYDYVYTMGTI
jgi:hypothetical protein